MNRKKRVSFNKSVTVKEFNLKHQVNDDQHTDLYQAPMDLTGCSIDSTTSEDMECTGAYTENVTTEQVTIGVSHKDTLLNEYKTEKEDNFTVSEISDINIDKSMLGSLGIQNMSISIMEENVFMGPIQKQDTVRARRYNTRIAKEGCDKTIDYSLSSSPEIKDLTVLQNNLLKGIREKTVNGMRQSPISAKRDCGENNMSVILKKQNCDKEEIEMGCSIDTTTSEDMDLTEVCIENNEDNFTVSEICANMTIDKSMLPVQNMTIVEEKVYMGQETARSKRYNMRPTKDSSNKTINCLLSSSPIIQDMTVLENNILKVASEEQPVMSTRKSTRLAKRASAENSESVFSKKQNMGVKEAIEISKSMTTQKVKPNLTGSSQKVFEQVNHSLTVTPVVQKIVVTPKLSSRLRSKKSVAVLDDVSRDQNEYTIQTVGVQNQSIGDQTPQRSCHGSSLKPVNIMSNSFKDQNRYSILNSTQNISLHNVTHQLLSNTPSQTNQTSFFSNFNESNIELLEPSLTSHDIQKVVNKELNEDSIIKDYMMKNQELDKEIEKVNLEDNRLNLEISRLEKELRQLPDEDTIALYMEIFDI